MANKTRSDIIAQLYAYVPNLNVSSHDVTVDNLCNIAAEIISSKHNFTYLRAPTPATYSAVADVHYVDETDFTFTNLKEILFLQWIKSATGENAPINYLPFQEFQERYSYVEYADNTDGKPRFYTRYGNRLHFNCQLDESVTIRAFYQQLHGNFTDDTTSHKFQPDNLGFHAIVSSALHEVHRFIPGLKLSPKAQQAAGQAEHWIELLIEADLTKSDESLEIEPNHRKEETGGITDPYSWVP